MTIAGNKARILMDSVNLSCITATLDIEQSVVEYDNTTLCSTAMEYLPGYSQGSIGVNGYFEGVETGEESRLYAALGAKDKTVAAILDYTLLPAPAYVIENASNLGMTWGSPTDGLITMNGSFKGDVGMRRGRVIAYDVTRNAIGNTTAVQLPGVITTSTGRVFGFLTAFAGTRTTPITLTVQTSANGTTGWTSEGILSYTALGAHALNITTPVGPYFNINVTSLGGATSVTFTVIVVID